MSTNAYPNTQTPPPKPHVLCAVALLLHIFLLHLQFNEAAIIAWFRSLEDKETSDLWKTLYFIERIKIVLSVLSMIGISYIWRLSRLGFVFYIVGYAAAVLLMLYIVVTEGLYPPFFPDTLLWVASPTLVFVAYKKHWAQMR